MTDKLKAKLETLQKDEKFLAEMNAAKTQKAKIAVLKKYGIEPTAAPQALSDEELDKVAGGINTEQLSAGATAYDGKENPLLIPHK